jgi:hypothetical protein
MGKMKIKNFGKLESYNIKTDYKELKAYGIKKPYTIKIDKTKYGMNDKYQIRLESEFDIEYIKVDLSTPYSFNPLESNYSYKNISQFDKSQTDEKYEFKIPRNPGKLFDLDLYLIPSDRYKIYVEINYPFFIRDEIEVSKNEGHILKYSTFIEEIAM